MRPAGRLARCARAALLTALVVVGATAAPAAAQTARISVALDGQPRVGAIAAGHLWVLADRGTQRILVEVDVSRARETGREVPVAEDVPADFPFLCPRCIRPSLAAAGGSLWAIDPGSGEVVQVDATRAVVVRRIAIGARYLAARAGQLWTLSAGAITHGVRRSKAFHRLDPLTGEVVETRTLAPARSGVGVTEFALGRTSIWTAEWSPSRFPRRFDLTTGTISRPVGGAWQMTQHAGTVYATGRNTSAISVYDRAPGAPARIGPLGSPFVYPRDLAAGPAGSVWIAFHLGGGRPGRLVQRGLDDRGPRRAIPIGADPVDVVAGRGVVWILDRTGATATRIPARSLARR